MASGRSGGGGRGPRGRSGAKATLRRIAIDISPLRGSRDFRLLWFGQLISLTGRQFTTVALPWQVYLLTGSPLAVGLISLVQVVPLIVLSIAGGAVADRWDRRKVILWTEFGMALSSGALLAGAIHGNPPLWYLYVVTGVQAGLTGLNQPARSASIPMLVSSQQLPAAFALNQVMFNTTLVVGPMIAGLIIAAGGNGLGGVSWAYGIDVVTFAASLVATLLLRPLRPERAEGEEATTGLAAIKEGFAFLRGKRVLNSTFYIDLVAMIFGMPRALFPALALTVFHVGAFGVGLMNAAPAAGALLGALTSGWLGGVRRQGAAVVWAVVMWGASIAAFGLLGSFFGLALVALAIAGAADVVSAVFRSTILQTGIPDSLRGRITAVHIMVVTGGPRIGDFESGLVASLTTPVISVVSGGLACIVGAAAIAWRVPEFWRYRAKRVSGVEDGRGLVADPGDERTRLEAALEAGSELAGDGLEGPRVDGGDVAEDLRDQDRVGRVAGDESGS
jgi:MFS family permease